MRTAALIVCLSAGAALAQSSSAPAFDAATIKPSQPGREVVESDPVSLSMRSVTLATCVRWAYDIQEFQLSAPGWLSDERFDLFAKPGAPAKEAVQRQMLQTLLADRFKLVVHRETKEILALVVTVGKGGHKLQPVDTEESPSLQPGKMSLTGKGATVGQMTEFLAHELRYPIIDDTGLKGRFNYTLDINSYITEELRKPGPDGGPPPDAPSIVAQAMKAQLGLIMSSKKMPVEMVVVDHAEKVPTEN